MTSAAVVKDWYTPAEIASLGLPGLPRTERAVQMRAKREAWAGRPRAGRGGGYEYPISVLPSAAREALLKRALRSDTVLARPEPSSVAATDLKDWQRRVMDARAAILLAVDRLAMATSRNQAVRTIVEAAKSGDLAPELQALVPVANARSGGKASLSRGQIYEWLRIRDEQGVQGLAPRPTISERVPTWASALMDLYARPQKPSLAFCVEQLQAEMGAAAPSYDQAKRFLRKLDTITRNQGRMGPRELKRLKAFVRRDTSELWPTAVYAADGHTFDAEVAHPAHGKPFRPEITTVIDIYTRRVVGWSIGLAETTWGVLDAIRHAFESSGICDIWYVDRGKGFNNTAFDAELTGFLARFGVTKTNSLPYNSQARGAIERVHQSLWVRGAKTLPTYMGEAMDPEARNRIFKITRAEIKAVGRSRALMPWTDFIEWCKGEVLAYNQRPHSALPKVRDHLDGRLRHASPNELWSSCVGEGFEPELVDGTHADLFRPYEIRTVRRAEVSLFSNTYFHPALEAYHGEQVLVGYDIHDASRVWVRDRDQRLICIAEFGGNRRSYFPTTVLEQARERRAKGRMLRLVERQREVAAELNPDVLLEQVNPMTAEELEATDRAFQEIEARAPIAQPEAPIATSEAAHLRLVEERPHFQSEFQWAQWLSLHPEKAMDSDRQVLREWLRLPSFTNLLQINGVDLGVLRGIVEADAISLSSRE